MWGWHDTANWKFHIKITTGIIPLTGLVMSWISKLSNHCFLYLMHAWWRKYSFFNQNAVGLTTRLVFIINSTTIPNHKMYNRCSDFKSVKSGITHCHIKVLREQWGLDQRGGTCTSQHLRAKIDYLCRSLSQKTFTTEKVCTSKIHQQNVHRIISCDVLCWKISRRGLEND